MGKGALQPLKPWCWKPPLGEFPSPSLNLQALLSP